MATDHDTVYELRQYTLHPGTRDAFVRLFEAELLDTQDAAGMNMLGQFFDADRPDAFVWVRAFPDMQRRRDALSAFYGGPVWAAHRDAANAMMIDSDDVLLLEPLPGAAGPAGHVGPRPAGDAPSAADGVVDVTIRPVAAAGISVDLARRLHDAAHVECRLGGRPHLLLQSLHTRNTFPQLPVREGGHFVVGLTRYADAAAAERVRTDRAYRAVIDDLDALAAGPVQRLRLHPTPRSALR